LSGGSDGTLRLWLYTQGILLHTQQLHAGDTSPNVLSLSFSAKDSVAAVVVEGVQEVQLYTVDQQTRTIASSQSIPFGSEGSQLIGARFSPDGILFAFGRAPSVVQFERKDGQYVDMGETDLLKVMGQVAAEGTKEEVEKALKAVSLESIRKLGNDEHQAKEAAWKEKKKQKQN